VYQVESVSPHPKKQKLFPRLLFRKSLNIRRKSSRDISVGIATGYGLDGRGVGVWIPVEARFFSSSCCPDRLWDPPSLLSNGYQRPFSRGCSGRGVKMTARLQLVQRSRIRGSIIHSPIRLHEVVLN
jgi:hypothetical protein